jgi:uncharacterized protein YbaP (TraB family)
MSRSVLWAIDVGKLTPLHVFGGGPGLAEPWSSPDIERLVAASDVFWNEVPDLGDEVQSLALRYGVDPEAPLNTWLTENELERVHDAATLLGVNEQLLAPVRPWLAAQIIKLNMEARAGLHAEHSAEQHLAATAERAGVPVRSEFGSAEDVFAAFSSWPRVVEVQRLLSIVDDVEKGDDALRRQSQAWLDGDLAVAEEIDGRMRERYAELHEHLIVRRNQAWVRRIQQMIAEGTVSFILAGTAHLVGADGVPALLDRAGIPASRV